MTVFGTTLDGAQIAGLVALLATLVLWLFALGNERGYVRWFKDREAGRKARHDTEKSAASSSSEKPPSGPWG